MAKTPDSRGLTLAEARSKTFEKVALYVVFLVALIAAVISFVALTWVGRQFMDWRVAPLLPVAVDGFAIACSVGIVRSQASGEPARERVSEWLGLYLALALSIAGNVQHAVVESRGSQVVPYLVIAFAAAVPIIVAYGIHVYGRSMARGISANVMADDPDTLVYEIRHLGDDAQGKRAPSARREPARPTVPAAPAARALTERPAAPARTEDAPAARPEPAARPARVDGGDKARVHELFIAAVAADPSTKPDASQIHTELGLDMNRATSRRWVQEWWAEFEAEQEAANPAGDSMAKQLETETTGRESMAS